MHFSEVEVRSLSAENRSMGFVELPETIPAHMRQRCLEHRHAKLSTPRPAARPVKQEPAASEAERNNVSRQALAARIRNLN
jgi:hypothetical protein